MTSFSLRGGPVALRLALLSARLAARLAALLAALLAGSGCADLRGRHQVREGNRLFRDGRYAEALRAYERAESLVPDLTLLWLNKGLTCHRMLVPGSQDASNQAAIACALAAFDRLRRLQPSNPRGQQLYVQTLFDADRFQTLADLYGERLRRSPGDIEAVNGMVQVYSRWNRVEEAIGWYQRRAELQPQDPEGQYAVGVYIWQQLFQRGGGPDKAAFDPRPDPNKKKGSDVKTPPLFGLGDIMGAQRAAMADAGIRYLERATALRPKYDAAMTYLNLLYRQKSFAFFNDPVKWQECVDAADRWRRAALAAQAAASPTRAAHP
jgi:tetratricopeptide (TPR) repeat protein